MLNRREILCLTSALLVLISIFTHHMLRVDLSALVGARGPEAAGMRLGLAGVTMCVDGECVSVNKSTNMGTVSFYLGIVSAIGLCAAAGMARLSSDNRGWRPAGLVTLLFGGCVIVWYLDVRFSSSELVGINLNASIGIGTVVGLVGVAIAAVVCLGYTNENFGSENLVRERQGDQDSILEKYSAKRHVPEESLPSADEPPKLTVENTASKSDTPVALRFLVDAIRISDQGLETVDSNGEDIVVRYSDIERIVARRLPESLGYDPALIVDIIAGRQGSPIRIVSKTKVNYNYLPGGESEDLEDNANQLIALMVSLQPDIQFDEGSRRFADQESEALPFQSEKHFWEYDSRYS